AVPVLSIIISPKVVVPVVVLQTLVTNLPLVVMARRHVQLGYFWPLMASAIAGIPFGALVLLFLDANALRLLIGAVVTAFALLLMAGVGYKVRRERLAFVPVGFVSGLLNGSSSLAGPPVILFFANQEIPPQVFRANILTYFFVTSFVAIAVFGVGNLLTSEVFLFTLLFLPAVALGSALGTRFAHRVRASVFRRITLAVVLLTGLVAIASGIGAL
ncbi:MAG: sulfite exporter TauE/SafE family protein, partial [Dehalococcoidia bacterium]